MWSSSERYRGFSDLTLFACHQQEHGIHATRSAPKGKCRPSTADKAAAHRDRHGAEEPDVGERFPTWHVGKRAEVGNGWMRSYAASRRWRLAYLRGRCRTMT